MVYSKYYPINKTNKKEGTIWRYDNIAENQIKKEKKKLYISLSLLSIVLFIFLRKISILNKSKKNNRFH